MTQLRCVFSASYRAILLTALLAAAVEADYSVQDNVAFNARKINPYTGGPAWEFSDTYELLDESFGPVTIGPLDADPLGVALEALFGVDLPHIVKLKTGASLSGHATVNFGYFVTAGRLDLSYPGSANLNFETAPGTTNYVQVNQSYDIDGSFLPGVSQRAVTSNFLETQGGPGYVVAPLRTQTEYQTPWFETTSPWASAWVEASADIQASIFTKASALGGLTEWRKDIRAGGKVGGRVVEIDPNGLYVAGEEVVGFDLTQPIGPIPIGGGAADLTIRVPNIAVSSVTNGSLQGSVLQAYKEQPLVTLTGNLERLIPFVGTILQNQIGPLGYDLLNLAGGPQLTLYQEMTFTPDPKVRLNFSEPVLVGASNTPTFQAEFDLDEAMNWKPMFSNSSTIQVTPTYLLNNTFRNETGLNVNLVLDVEALSLTGDFPPFNGTLGPAYTEEVTIPIFEGGELFAPQFNIPLGSVGAGSVPGIGPITTGVITFQKSNLDIEVGLGDLELVSSAYVQPDPNNQGYEIWDLDFARAVDGGSPRTYEATVSVIPDYVTPETVCHDGCALAFYLESLEDIILTDPVTSEQYNLGSYICANGCNQSLFLPAPSPAYVDPNPSLGTLYVTTLPDDLTFVPNVDLNVPGHPTLDQYNPIDDFIQDDTVEESTEYVDQREYPATTVLVRTGDVIPDGIGRFDEVTTPAYLASSRMNDAGEVSFHSSIDAQVNLHGYYFADDLGKAKLVRSGDPVPGGDGVIQLAGDEALATNNVQQGAFVADISNSSSTRGVFRSGPAGLTLIARNGQSAPNGGTIEYAQLPQLNDAGKVVFLADVGPGAPDLLPAIIVGDGTALTEIVRAGDTVPGLGEPLTGVDSHSINNSGEVAFFAYANNGSGVYVGDGNTPTPIAISGGAAPGGGQFDFFVESSSINESGYVAFVGYVETTPGANSTFGIYRGNGASTVSIAQVGDLDEDADGTLKEGVPTFLQLNDLAHVVFRGAFEKPDSTIYEAIVIGAGGGLQPIARSGSIPDNADDPISAFSRGPQVNNQDQVAFEGVLATTPGNARSIFVHDGNNLLQIVTPGQPLAGSSVADSGLVGINDEMQVAYWAALADGREVIARFEPRIYWHSLQDGNWDAQSNWSLGIDPISLYDVFITTESSVTVTGPFLGANVKSLTLGGEGSNSAILKLRSGATITATNGTTILPNGFLNGTGTLAGSLMNEGDIRPGAALAGSPGAISLNGDFTQASIGKLTIEIASPTSYDQLLIDGDVTLGGTLAVSLLGGFVPALGQQFSILGGSIDSITGAFQQLNLPTFSGLTFDVIQNANSLLLEVVESTGDFNHDGFVNAADYVIWRKGAGVATTPANYNVWRTNFGESNAGSGGAGSAGASSLIPEPGNLALAAAGLASLLSSSRRRRCDARGAFSTDISTTRDAA